jgi:nucleotide-binding universal stress UspA family protein
MKLINRILFPVDFSDSCRAAARYVEAMAGRFEAEIMLLHIVEPGEQMRAEELLPLRLAQLDAYLADELKYFTTRRVCVAGCDPAAEIVAAAREWQPELVMLPTRGRGAFRRHTLGSVTAKLLKELDCPVWTSVHNDAALPLEEIHCRMVLCGVDLSDRSEYVLEWAAAMATENDAELAIIHAMKPIRQPVLAVGIQEELTGSAAADARRAIDRLRHTAGTRAPVFLEEGDTASVVAGIEKEFGADLLVVGRHERGPENAFAIIRESPCPVISC